ncbi:Peptidase S8/S53 domain containing protein [Amanita muscaria]
MVRLWRSALVLGLAYVSLASPLQKRWDDLVEKHSWTEIPKGWTFDSAAPAEHKLDLRIGLKQEKFDELIANLMQVSDPFHERYGQHLSQEEVDALIAPHPDSVRTVGEWLSFHDVNHSDITRPTGAGDWIIVRVSVAQAERMLGAKYNVYYHPASSERVVRTIGYSLPRELHSHINVVAPTTYFGTMRTMRATSFLQPEIQPISDATPPSTCRTTITPSCLRTLYNTINYVPTSTSTNKLGVAGYLDEYANRVDLQTFFSRFRTDAQGSSYTTVLVNGGLDDQTNPGTEANLDIQYTTGISYPTPNTYYSTGGSPPFIPDSNTPTDTNEPYLDWLNFVLSQSTIPQVITTSYGDDEQTVPYDYAVSVCNLFAQLGARGTTAFFSSGDAGVGGGSCTTNDGTNRVIFQPDFPASCPYVTTVGGTHGISPETAISFSGGGFSNYFARPSYQQTAVSQYVAGLGTTYSGLYNASSRAYPDLAAQSNGFQVVIGGSIYSVGGTSASSPTVAAIFSLLTDYRLAHGKASFGFLNPLLYSGLTTGFNDITSGNNPGCGTNGFTAKTGWDPVTGWGTPDFLKLQALV